MTSAELRKRLHADKTLFGTLITLQLAAQIVFCKETPNTYSSVNQNRGKTPLVRWTVARDAMNKTEIVF